MANDLFEEINNAVLDLQSSDYQSAYRPLNRISELLDHEDLKELNIELTKGVDFDEFLRKSNETGGSMVGSKSLSWPKDRREDLALRLILTKKLSDSNFVLSFGYDYYSGGSSKINAVYNGILKQLIIPFVRDYRDYVIKRGRIEPKIFYPVSKRVFIVHGHDDAALHTVARFIEKLDLEAVILNEQANRGRAIIQKIEDNSDVGFAIVLLTPDDLGRSKESVNLEPRARQNVLLELGYFIAKLGREHVCALKKGEVEIPSDFAGILWEELDAKGGWKLSLARELQAAGQQIDLNLAMGG